MVDCSASSSDPITRQADTWKPRAEIYYSILVVGDIDPPSAGSMDLLVWHRSAPEAVAPATLITDHPPADTNRHA